MTPAPLTLDEIARRLEAAARAETFGLHALEVEAARPGASALFSEALAEIRRQALALGAAHQVVSLLAQHPTLTLGADRARLADLAATYGDD
jgi:hypothetical protein